MAAESEAQRLEQARRFRRDFGLEVSEERLRELDRELTGEPSSRTLNVPLTPEEMVVMVRKGDLSAAGEVISDYGAAHSNVYAGSWIEHHAGGGETMNVGFTADAEAHLRALRQVFPYPEALRLFPADLSHAELESLADRVYADDEILRRLGIQITAISVDEATNAVVVEEPEPTDAHDVLLKERFGPKVRLEAGGYAEI